VPALKQTRADSLIRIKRQRLAQGAPFPVCKLNPDSLRQGEEPRSISLMARRARRSMLASAMSSSTYGSGGPNATISRLFVMALD